MYTLKAEDIGFERIQEPLYVLLLHRGEGVII
jgi:hypothetical protein